VIKFENYNNIIRCTSSFSVETPKENDSNCNYA